LLSADTKSESWLTRSTWWLDQMLCRVPGLNRYAWYCLIELQNG
jgi:hypothetical protein